MQPHSALEPQAYGHRASTGQLSSSLPSCESCAGLPEPLLSTAPASAIPPSGRAELPVRLRLRWLAMGILVFAIGLTWAAPCPAYAWWAAAQDDDEDAEEAEEEDSDEEQASYSEEEVSEPVATERRPARARSTTNSRSTFFGDRGVFADAVPGVGAQGQLGHIVGPTLGRDTSITPLELFPYVLSETGMWFGDIRTFITNRSRFGGNFGTGYRYFDSGMQRVFGASGWYDSDGSTGTTFQQLGLSLETLGDWWDLRANFYLPIGSLTRDVSDTIVPGSLRYSGYNILYDRDQLQGHAMRGLDMEAGMPIWGKLADQHDLRVYAGWYHFQGSDVQQIWGWKGRIQANFTPEVPMYIQLTSDQVYHTNLIFGFSFAYSGKLYDQRTSRKTPYGRIGEYVRRNYNVISPTQSVVTPGLKAINPVTRQAYVVEHVDSNASGSQTGTVLDPYATVAQAQAAHGDIIVIHADSVFSGANAQVAMNQGDRIFGDGAGVQNVIRVANYGNIVLPHATDGTDRPLFQNATGDAFTLGTNSELQNVVISGSAGAGILANGIDSAIVRHVDVLNAGGDSVLVRNSTGLFSFSQNNFTNAGGATFHVDGGSANIKVDDDISNSGGNRTILIENTADGGKVDFTGSTIVDNGGSGILIANNTGNVLIKDATLNNTVGDAITVVGGIGAVAFVGDTTITNPSGVGVKVDNLASTGIVNFSNLEIDGRNDKGIELNKILGYVNFLGDTTIGTRNSGTGAGVDIHDSSGAVTFNTLSIADSGGAGIHIGDNLAETPGSVVFAGLTSLNGTSGPGVSITDNNSQVQFNGLNIANRFGTGVSIDHTVGGIAFLGTNNITNGANSTSSGIDIQNSTGNVGFATTTISDATGAAGVNLANNTGITTFDTLNIGSNGGTGIKAFNAGTLIVTTGGVIDSISGTAVDLQGTALNMQLDSVSSQGATNGIRLVDTTGQFAVWGDGTNLGSGGVIQNSTNGVYLSNARNVTLQLVDITNNNVGVSSTNTSNVQLTGVRITGSTTYGIDALNTGSLQVTSSLLENNGGTSFNSIRFQANQVGTYGLNVSQSTIDGTSASGIAVNTLSGGEGATLGLSVLNNVISNTQGGASGVSVAWNGPLTATFTGNAISGTGGTNRGIDLTNSSLVDASTLTINNNKFTFSGGSDTAINLNTAGPVSLGTIAQNTITLNNSGSTGINIAVAGTSSTYNINSNLITTKAGSGTGILFSPVAGPVGVTFNNNQINMSGSSSDRGFAFANATSTFTLSGTQNNLVNGAGTAFAYPAPWVAGHFWLNGSQVP